MAIVRLLIDGHEFDAEVEDRTSATSIHTGRELETVNVSFVTPGEGSLLDAAEIYNCAIDSKSYKGRVRSSSFREVSGYSAYVVELAERESFSTSRLTIDGLDVEPAQYREDGDDGVLVLTVRCTILAETLDAFFERRAEGAFFPVVRHGIQDVARTMRFGAIFWSATPTPKAEFTLVETGWDERNKLVQGLLNARDGNTERIVAATSELLDGLIDLLVENGAVPNDGGEKLRSRAREVGATRRSLYKVPDIDDFPFD